LAEYRLRIFDRFGVDRAGVTFPCDTDEEATRDVEEHSAGHLMELWEGDRLVKRFEAVETPGAFPRRRPEAR
jgi:hypothetical protein